MGSKLFYFFDEEEFRVEESIDIRLYKVMNRENLKLSHIREICRYLDRDMNFIFIIDGEEEKINFYIGVSILNKKINIEKFKFKVFEKVLKRESIIVEEIYDKDIEEIQKKIREGKIFKFIDGLSISKKHETIKDSKFEYMLDDTNFIIECIITPLATDDMDKYEKNIFNIYDSLYTLSQIAYQILIGGRVGKTDIKTMSGTDTKTDLNSLAIAKNKNKLKGYEDSKKETNGNKGKAITYTTQRNKTETKEKTLSFTDTGSIDETWGENVTVNLNNKEYLESIKYIDECILPTIKKFGKGNIYNISLVFAVECKIDSITIEAELKRILGSENEIVNIRFVECEHLKNTFSNFKIPKVLIKDKRKENKIGKTIGGKLFSDKMMFSVIREI